MSLLARLLSLLVMLAFAASAVNAQQIDLSLNVIYSNPSNPASAGTWQLVGKSSHSGIVAVNTFLTGITAASAANVAPRGVVNGDPCSGSMNSGCAGFFNFGAFGHPGYIELVVSQAPIGFLDPGDEEAMFYGVGTLTNGAPNYPGKPGGSNSIGPAFTSLTGVQGVAWATGDVFSNPAWSTAAILASGNFTAGMTPGFYGPLDSSGAVFTSIGTSTVVGNIASALTVTEIVRTNLVVAVNDGDYNNDGVVNAADYVVWRDALGKTVTPFSGADGNGNGTIDAPDYTHWRQRFGNLSPGAGVGAGSTAIPEPGTWFLVAVALTLLAATRSRVFEAQRSA